MMIGENEFKNWVESAHLIFEIFEGRYDAYPLAHKWVDEWFCQDRFTVQKDDCERLKNLRANFSYEVFGIRNNEIKTSIDTQFSELLSLIMNDPREKRNIGYAVSPFLFTWNFQRFKEYFIKRSRNFSLQAYFENSGAYIKEQKLYLKEFRKKNLIHDEITEKDVTSVFAELNNKLKQLGINQNEPVGTSKLLHIISPHYFPLIDNKIAEATKLKIRNESLTSSHYLKWMASLQEWLQPRAKIVNELEGKYDLSILKLVDEGFYVMTSINLSLRIEKLGISLRK